MMFVCMVGDLIDHTYMWYVSRIVVKYGAAKFPPRGREEGRLALDLTF